MAAYLALCLPICALRHAGPAIFINAGDRYVNAAALSSPIPVKQNSDGYDGQFYARMAAHPFSLAPTEGGITFDHPAKRMERILYPLLAWALSFGRPAATAWSLFAINLAGIGAIAWAACRIAQRLSLPVAFPVAIMLWPGFIVALTHDTTEIASTAFLMGALDSYLADRLAAYAALAIAATLARETTLPVFLGILAYNVAKNFFQQRTRPNWPRLAVCAGVVVPFALWREILATLAHEAPQAHGLAHDLGWPFIGAATMLWDCVTGARAWASTPMKDGIIRAIVLLTAPPLLAFCAATALRLKPAFAHTRLAGVATGWVLTAALMTLLTNTGPWIDPIAYTRAFTDCFVVGCLLLFATGFWPSLRWVAVIGGCEMVLVWALCLIKLR